jgi:hypothetical protein
MYLGMGVVQEVDTLSAKLEKSIYWLHNIGVFASEVSTKSYI